MKLKGICTYQNMLSLAVPVVAFGSIGGALYQSYKDTPTAKAAYSSVVQNNQLPIVTKDGSRLNLNCSSTPEGKQICSVVLNEVELRRAQKAGVVASFEDVPLEAIK